MRWAVCCVSLSLLAAAGMAAGPQARGGALSFNRDIRPILSNNCFACHGPDEKQRETKFHFDTREGAFLEAGVIAGRRRGQHAGAADHQSGSREADAAARFGPFADGGADCAAAPLIDEGAIRDTHWAYTAPVRTEPPATRDRGWARTPIDRFILARLEREGLEPSDEADRSRCCAASPTT